MRFNPAYPAMLAHDWNKKGQPNITGYWASEKYDGLRALWDGENFYSRNGKIFHAPQWFKDTLPNTPLDGELWLERSVAGYQKAVSAVRKKVGGKEWENITYMVFDIPTSTEPFEKVQAKLKRMNLGKYGEVVPQYKVKSKSDMLKHYEAALAEGAEGIMLREPGSRYTATRSASLLKVKPEDTAEAVVTGYQAGTGKHRGRMGALHVYLLGDKSKVFKIGTGFKDYQRESPPPIGSIVEFKFNDKTARGIPRFPAFLRVRTDMMDDRPKTKKAPKPQQREKKTMAKKPKGKRVLFSGSRHWDRVDPVRAVISSISRGSTVIHGGAKGLDSLAGRLAQEKGLEVEVYEADWSRGRKAGPERNQEMVDAGADIVYAFPVEGSRGTWDLVKRARKAGIPVQVYGEDFGTTKAAKPKGKKTMPPRITQTTTTFAGNYDSDLYEKKFKNRDVWSPDGDLGNTYTHDQKPPRGQAGRISKRLGLVAQESAGDGMFYYPEVTFATKKEMQDAQIRVEKAFKAGKIYVPSIFKEPYSKAAKAAIDSFKAATGPGLAERIEKATKPKATKPKATKDAAHYFSMGSKDLLRDGSAGAKKELRRRGRDPKTGKKV